MPSIDFALYPYYPDLLCSSGEHMGYGQLSLLDQSSLLPIFGLSRQKQAADFEDSVARVRLLSGSRPFILDLDHRPAPEPYLPKKPKDPVKAAQRFTTEKKAQELYNKALAHLLQPHSGFRNWRELAMRFPNAIPMLQYTDPEVEGGEILREAALLAENDNSLAIRIGRKSKPDVYPVIANILRSLGSPERLLIVLDCGQGRREISARTEFAADAIQAIISEYGSAHVDRLRIVCMSNSLHQPNHDAMKSIVNLDWKIWRGVRRKFPVMFGDYGAVFRPRTLVSYIPGDWRPTVVYPLDEGWLVFRDENANDPNGWIRGSQAIVARDEYSPAPPVWGSKVIENANIGSITGVDSARFWYAVKVNIHLHRQREFAERIVG